MGIEPTQDTSRPTGRRRQFVTSMTVAVLVVGLAVGIAILNRGDGSRRTVGTSTSAGSETPRPSPGGPASNTLADAASEAATRERVHELLARAVLPPGAVPAGSAPGGLLTAPTTMAGTPNLVDDRAWWTAPGTMAEAISYLTAHPPAGLVITGSASAGSDRTKTLFAEMVFLGAPVGDGDEGDLQLAVVTYDGGVAIRADAQDVWLINRTAVETIPADVRSVDVTLTRSAPPSATRRTLNAAAALRLAKMINALPAQQPGPSTGISCPAERPGINLLFHAPAGPLIRVEADILGCALAATVTVGGVPQPALAGIDSVYGALLADLGLPADSGRIR